MTPADWVAWFEAAAAQQGVSSRQLDIAGRSLRIDVAGGSVLAALDLAFGPLVTDDPTPRGGHLIAWADAHHPLGFGEAAAAATRLPDGGLHIRHILSAVAEAFVPDHSMMLWGRAEAFTDGDVMAQPASTAIAAWLAHSGAFALHAGAVGDAKGAALLLGRGGAGKSTTALACAARGMRMLGDDVCIVTTDGAPMVHGLYATAKLTRDSEHRLGLAARPSVARTSKGKKVVALGDKTFIRSAPLVALIVLAKSCDDSKPVALSHSDIMRALAPTALKAATGAYPLGQWLRTAAFLARNVPGFLVGIDWDLDAVVSSIADSLAAGKSVLNQ